MRIRERRAEAKEELVKLFCTAREKIQQPGHRRRWKFCSAASQRPHGPVTGSRTPAGPPVAPRGSHFLPTESSRMHGKWGAEQAPHGPPRQLSQCLLGGHWRAKAGSLARLGGELPSSSFDPFPPSTENSERPSTTTLELHPFPS